MNAAVLGATKRRIHQTKSRPLSWRTRSPILSPATHLPRSLVRGGGTAHQAPLPVFLLTFAVLRLFFPTVRKPPESFALDRSHHFFVRNNDTTFPRHRGAGGAFVGQHGRFSCPTAFADAPQSTLSSIAVVLLVLEEDPC